MGKAGGNQLSTEGRKLSNEASSWLSKYQEVVNKGIWCFDLEGNLIWKMPQAYPEEVHLEELKETGHRAWAAYLGMRINALNDDEVVGWTSYGDHVVARISDGTLVEHYKEGGIPHIRKGTYL